MQNSRHIWGNGFLNTAPINLDERRSRNEIISPKRLDYSISESEITERAKLRIFITLRWMELLSGVFVMVPLRKISVFVVH